MVRAGGTGASCRRKSGSVAEFRDNPEIIQATTSGDAIKIPRGIPALRREIRVRPTIHATRRPLARDSPSRFVAGRTCECRAALCRVHGVVLTP
jgi:hypothetical protein